MPSYDDKLEPVLTASVEEKRGFSWTGRLTEGREVGEWLGWLALRTRTAEPSSLGDQEGIRRQLKEASRLVTPEHGVLPIELQEFLVGALLHDAPLIQHQQTVEAGDGREAVGNGDYRLALHQSEQLILDSEFHFA